MGKFVLTLYFACAAGCGQPSSVSLAPRYDSVQECKSAGDAFVAPAADPNHVIARYSCNAAQK